MPGSPGTRPAPDLPAERRLALVVATAKYTDSALRALRSPARDASALGELLAAPDIGGFSVETVLNRKVHEVRLAIESFLADRSPQDLLLVYLSCHGLVDPRRRLYFAAKDTRKDRLASTGLESQWLLDQLEDCRARRQVVILDCCFSGAFAHGAKGSSDLGLERLHGPGRGRAVLTASRASEYSFEGKELPGSPPGGSLFTDALVEGIRTGAADLDHDGYISVDDAYTYAFERMQADEAQQTPQRWLYGAEGKILLARSPAGIVLAPRLMSKALRGGLENPLPPVRLGAVEALAEWLSDPDPERVLTARTTLRAIADHDIPRVAAAARAWLDSAPQPAQAVHAAPVAVPGADPTKLPALNLTHLVAAARNDPRARSRTTDAEVRTLQKALAQEGLLAPELADGHFGTRTIQAYAAWQRRLGYGGLSDDGVPGELSLKYLGKRHGFRVAKTPKHTTDKGARHPEPGGGVSE